MGGRIELRAYAKFNPGILVKGIREGIFCLDITWQLLDLFDLIEMRIEAGSGRVIISSDDPRLPVGTDEQARGNNCLSACMMMKEFAGSEIAGWDIGIHISKRIPFSGGLGGSASDSSAVMRGMNRLFSMGLSDVKLSEMSASIGHDCAFFSLGSPAARGREKRDGKVPIGSIKALNGVFVAVLYPRRGDGIFSGNVYASLARVYSERESCWREGRLAPDMDSYLEALERSDWLDALSFMGNDLEEAPIISSLPFLSALRKEAAGRGAHRVMVSGSGPSIVAFFETSACAADFLEWGHSLDMQGFLLRPVSDSELVKSF